MLLGGVDGEATCTDAELDAVRSDWLDAARRLFKAYGREAALDATAPLSHARLARLIGGTAQPRALAEDLAALFVEKWGRWSRRKRRGHDGS